MEITDTEFDELIRTQLTAEIINVVLFSRISELQAGIQHRETMVSEMRREWNTREIELGKECDDLKLEARKLSAETSQKEEVLVQLVSDVYRVREDFMDKKIEVLVGLKKHIDGLRKINFASREEKQFLKNKISTLEANNRADAGQLDAAMDLLEKLNSNMKKLKLESERDEDERS